MNDYKRVSYVMHLLHDGVIGSHHFPVSDQIERIVDKIDKFYEGEDKESVITAAYLHKSFERKLIKPKFFETNNDLPFGYNELKRLFGEASARIVFLLSTEPNDTPVNGSISTATTMDLAKQRWCRENPDIKTNNMSEKELAASAVALWAKELPTQAQVILLAQNWQYFELSRDRPNIRRPFSWSREEYRLRMFTVDAIQDSCPKMYQECLTAKKEALRTIDLIESTVLEERKKLQRGKHE